MLLCTANRFEVFVPAVHLRQVFLVEGEPLADLECTISGAGPDYDDVSDAEGGIDLVVPVYAESVTIAFADGNEYLVDLGYLDPANTPSGAAQRLRQLAYLPRADEAELAISGPDLASALAGFQKAHELEATGMLDDATVEALQSALGS